MTSANTWEEINLGVKQGNFGWPLREGFVATPTGGVGGELASRVDTLYAYLNGAGPRSVVGGVVYRGAAADLHGKYLFAEFYTGEIWRMDKDGSNVDRIDGDLGFSGTPVGFGEDGNGDVYLVDFDGRVLRFDGDLAMPSAKSVPAITHAVAVMVAASMVVIVVAAIRETG